MSKFHSLLMIGLAASAAMLSACDDGTSEDPGAAMTSDDAVSQVYAGNLTVADARARCRCKLEVVPVSGTVFHFGLDLSQSPPDWFPFQSTVAGTRVWIAEVPLTRLLNVRADADGKWSIGVVKLVGHPLPLSFVYELDGYATTKSPIFPIGDAALTDVSVQLPTAAYFGAAKGQIEQQLGALLGVPYSLRNVLVTTVGKSWASMYSPELPHGDPGATVSITPAIAFPASVGPIYFNEQVSPDPTYTATSVDGGVLFGNLPGGRVTISASKAPYTYDDVTFTIQDGIELYVASPPHANQGTNGSPAGQP